MQVERSPPRLDDLPRPSVGSRSELEKAFQVDLGPSLRDVQQQRCLRDQRESYSVIAYACKLPEDAPLDRVAAVHTQLIRATMTRTAQRATGVLLLQPGAALHLVEAAYEFTGPFMRALYRQEERPQLIDACAVVIKLEDKPNRIFSEWSCHTVNAPSETVHLSDEDPVDASQALLESLAEIGQRMEKLGHVEGQAFTNEFSSLLTSAERIQAMAECRDYMALDDYMMFFEAPMDRPFESDLVWPMQENTWA